MSNWRKPHPRWIWRGEAPPAAVERLAAAADIPRTLAEILWRRRLEAPEIVQSFLRPSLAQLIRPDRLMGMDRAVDRLMQAIERNERITVFGDYDVDGVTSACLLLRFFSEMGLEGRIGLYIPDRLAEGYGPNLPALLKLGAQGTKVVITVDSGISAVEPVRGAQEAGIDVIVTDHHMPGPVLPPAHAIVNPKQPGCGFGYKSLAGVGLAFHLAAALRSRLRDAGYFNNRPEPNLKRLLDLVAIGTVADVSPLTGENRILVKEGLEVMARSANPGVRALLSACGLEGRSLEPHHIGFQIGPRLNAIGRLGHASKAVQLLTTEDPSEAEALVAELEAANEERRRIEGAMIQSIEQRFDREPGYLEEHYGICLVDSGWHPGVIGIVASRLVDRTHKPTILIALHKGMGKASARSIESLDLYEAIASLAGHLVKFGGHYMAAGLTVREESIPALQEGFERVLRERLDEESLRPTIKLEVDYRPEELGESLIFQLERLAPFGPLNPRPVGRIGGLVVQEKRILKDRHLKLALTAGGRIFDSIGFELAAQCPVGEGDRIDAAAMPEINEFRGSRRLQLRLEDIRPAANPGR